MSHKGKLVIYSDTIRNVIKQRDRLLEDLDEARRYAEAMYPYWPAQKPLPWVEVDNRTDLD